jgi:hypothetical protein
MKCPKCSFEQADGSTECASCQIIFAKWKQVQARPTAPAPQAAAASSGGVDLGGLISKAVYLALIGAAAYGYFHYKDAVYASIQGKMAQATDNSAAGRQVRLQNSVPDIPKIKLSQGPDAATLQQINRAAELQRMAPPAASAPPPYQPRSVAVPNPQPPGASRPPGSN